MSEREPQPYALTNPRTAAIPYELTNPHDAAVIAAADLRVAAAAALLLGVGEYGLMGEDGATVMPIFLVGGDERWLREHGITDLAAFMVDHRAAIADCLDGIFYGTPAEWRAAGPLTAEQRAAHNEPRRRSMRNLAGMGARLARQMRDRHSKETPK